MILTEDRLSTMKGTQTLYLLFISGLCLSALGSSDFHIINIVKKNYAEAKNYCRQMYTDLASVHNSIEMNHLITLVPSINRAWIGLETGKVWMWHWSLPDENLDFFRWKDGQPQIKNEDACAFMDKDGEWIASDCGTKRSFVCHGNEVASGLIVTKTKSWRDAQNHCRDLSYDLISIHSAEENEAVHDLSKSENVWIGLFKDSWKWSDGSMSSFRYWLPAQPNYLKGQNCTAVIFKNQGKWNDLKCAGKRHFVCQGARKSIPTTTHQSTEGTTEDLTTLYSSTSQEVLITFHFNVVSNTSHTSKVTTEEATTANRPTTPNTTDRVSSTSSTELNNAATEMSTVTATQQIPTTTTLITRGGISTITTLKPTSADTTSPSLTLKPTKTTTTTALITSGGISTLPTLKATSADTTSPSLTLKPTATSHSLLTGNLILVRKNMTWIEAMGYCRDHHIDLIHITTKDIQGKVADMAKKATSPHVWLGLRFTCKFNFWFWTNSTTSCYQNWAPGQGPTGRHDCGVTGAIDTTGRQQWVGLPETEQLNFICSTCTE
ncbi:C-type mannose receptor 2 [Trematomus bernacchii]|uniref:C-type mannose receptor 2 n=1 Tax=Trematomus bernacchii TaxID=40690 RepID=UPI00146A5B40|nr:C-type mannose receptor 2 [Trematomus bernacchii]